MNTVLEYSEVVQRFEENVGTNVLKKSQKINSQAASSIEYTKSLFGFRMAVYDSWLAKVRTAMEADITSG
jgi:hypothetical protein